MKNADLPAVQSLTDCYSHSPHNAQHFTSRDTYGVRVLIRETIIISYKTIARYTYTQMPCRESIKCYPDNDNDMEYKGCIVKRVIVVSTAKLAKKKLAHCKKIRVISNRRCLAQLHLLKIGLYNIIL